MKIKGALKYFLYLLGFKAKENFKSKGELFIEAWLNYNKIRYKAQYKVFLNKIARNSNIVYLDFMINHNSQKIAVEYNGRQHYKFVPYFHKDKEDYHKQIRRDNLVREWCEKKKIKLIEIPYTMSANEISNLLQRELG